jgi:hypothetical protein
MVLLSVCSYACAACDMYCLCIRTQKQGRTAMPVTPSPVSKLTLYLVLFDYAPVDDSELALAAGDLVTKVRVCVCVLIAPRLITHSTSGHATTSLSDE